MRVCITKEDKQKDVKCLPFFFPYFSFTSTNHLLNFSLFFFLDLSFFFSFFFFTDKHFFKLTNNNRPGSNSCGPSRSLRFVLNPAIGIVGMVQSEKKIQKERSQNSSDFSSSIKQYLSDKLESRFSSAAHSSSCQDQLNVNKKHRYQIQKI